MNPLKPFHLAVVVDDLSAARRFYGNLLGCSEGRSSEQWVDFDFFGHQFVVHLGNVGEAEHNPVDGEQVPVPHFGVVLTIEEWKLLRDRLEAASTEFILKPQIRFEGEVGEQATMFFRDPAGNHLEFKAMRNPENLFTKPNA